MVIVVLHQYNNWSHSIKSRARDGKKNSVHQSQTPSISIYSPRLPPNQDTTPFSTDCRLIIPMCSFKKPRYQSKTAHRKRMAIDASEAKNIIQKQKERSAHQKLTTFRVPYWPRGDTICLRITLWSWASSSVVDRLWSSRHQHQPSSINFMSRIDWSPGIKNLTEIYSHVQFPLKYVRNLNVSHWKHH